jgi:hypothetical protein
MFSDGLARTGPALRQYTLFAIDANAALVASQPLPRRQKLGSRRVENRWKCPILLARSEGFEPPTPRFEVWCSIQLSYERTDVS